MRRLLELYFRLIQIQIRTQLVYRSGFWMDALATLFATLYSFGTLVLVFQRFGNISGWNIYEVGLLYGIVETGFGVMDMLFSGFDPQNFGRQVRLGRLDLILLRPVNTTLQVFASEFIIRRLGRIAQGLMILFFASAHLPIQWSLSNCIYLLVVLFSAIMFFGGLFIIGATFTFWTFESIEIINIFTYGGSEMMSYPMNIYPNWLRHFFTYVIPGIFLVYYPALYLLQKPDPLHMPWFAPFLAPFAGAGILALSLLFWQFGLKYYQSTGS